MLTSLNGPSGLVATMNYLLPLQDVHSLEEEMDGAAASVEEDVHGVHDVDDDGDGDGDVDVDVDS